MHKNSYILRGAGIIYYNLVNNNTEILCVKGKQSGKWGLPKGSLKKKETLKQCAIREMQEETNIKITKVQINSSESISFGNHIYFIIYGNQFTNIKTNDINEIEEIQWMTENDIDNLKKKFKNIGLRKLSKFLKKNM